MLVNNTDIKDFVFNFPILLLLEKTLRIPSSDLHVEDIKNVRA